MSELFAAGQTAVITGAASGIGQAAARRLASRGLKLCLFDRNEAALRAVADGLSTEVRIVAGDVAKMEDVGRLHDVAYEAFGEVNLLMNNAAIGGAGSGSWTGLDRWRAIIEVNLFGVVNGVHRFAPSMLAQGSRAAIVNTGSKQGITNPPGAPAYAVAKAGVRTLTEQLDYELSQEPGSQVTAHLLVPGWTFTGMTRGGHAEKPAGAWSAEQVVDLMIEKVGAGDFYVICPDNAVTAEMDRRRIRWGADDLVENRPALSRWRPEWKDRFDAFMAGSEPSAD